MKICWDNIKNFYITIHGNLRDNKGETYDSFICLECEEDFLSRKGREASFCDRGCRTIYLQRKGIYKSPSKGGLKGEESPNWKGGVVENNLPFYDTYADKISFADRVRRNKYNSNILETTCTYCNDWFIPTRINISTRAKRINDDLSRLYCSDKCKKECSIYWRSNTPKDYQLVTSRDLDVKK